MGTIEIFLDLCKRRDEIRHDENPYKVGERFALERELTALAQTPRLKGLAYTKRVLYNIYHGYPTYKKTPDWDKPSWRL